MKNIKDMSKIYLNESHIRAIIKETLENLILGEDETGNKKEMPIQVLMNYLLNSIYYGISEHKINKWDCYGDVVLDFDSFSLSLDFMYDLNKTKDRGDDGEWYEYDIVKRIKGISVITEDEEYDGLSGATPELFEELSQIIWDIAGEDIDEKLY